ncbi:unnamed protein product [Paramecium pentaurelia]|uniref:Uncharacterized protein n=1 Tax=Paramecium pentaurelia TaxID=43138 RepID=A0A8S1UZ21_9CILI|nr:unnamed protein product [Paramecium pentaurelia]
MNKGQSPRRDHSPNFFYNITNDNYMYKRSADTQQTDLNCMTKQARNYVNNANITNSPKPAGSPSRMNFTMQNKYFHQSNIFDGVQQTKEYKQPEQPLKEKQRDNKSPSILNGAQINKNYNCTSGKSQPIINKSKQITVEFQTDNNNFDALDLKRSLLKQGIQISDIQMKNPINSGRTKNIGNITVKGDEEKLSILHQELEKVGLKTHDKPNNYYKQQADHSWVLQKQKYDKIEYFKNR